MPQTMDEWFEKDFRREYNLYNDITKKAERIFTKMPPHVIGTMAQFQLTIEIEPKKDGGTKLALMEPARAYVGAMAEAILEALEGQLVGLIESGKADNLIKQKINQVFSDMVKFSTTQQAPDGQTWLACPHCTKLTPATGKHCIYCGLTIK